MSWTLVIHGGAGLIARHSLDDAREAACRGVLTASLDAGAAVLAGGGDALDATLAAVRVMEDSPLFNAGRGAVYAADGTHQFDASLMRSDGRSGAVAAVRGIRHPIDAARAVLEEGTHVLLAGAGAEAFARAVGLEFRDPDWFYDARRWEHFRRAAAAGTVALDHELEDPKTGTVGAVAVDAEGRLAASTSTGGMANKRVGRVGDSAIVGAGTWADARCAISGTGHGERFIQAHVTGRIADLVQLAGLSLSDACDRVIHEELPRIDGRGGVIAVGADGSVALPFNSGGMYRGWARHTGERQVAIW
jgi:beta-aspartyl-peptidase (threonine type)